MIEQFYDLRPDVLELDRKALELCREPFCHVEEIRDYNQLKMLRAFTDCGVEARHFWGSSGYGVWDDSRNKLEEVFARCMGAEAALVRSQFMSGTHTLTVALFGLLRTGDTLLAATGRPYDTLEGVIGIGEAGKGCGTLREYGVNYDECPLLPDNTPDYALIAEKAKTATVVHIQRSRGYMQRNAFDLETIRRVAETARKANPDAVIFVDNCYGEFTQTQEPLAASPPPAATLQAAPTWWKSAATALRLPASAPTWAAPRTACGIPSWASTTPPASCARPSRPLSTPSACWSWWGSSRCPATPTTTTTS